MSEPFLFSSFAVDIWSVGCIMGEMIRGGVLFPGTDRILFLISPRLQRHLSLQHMQTWTAAVLGIV